MYERYLYLETSTSFFWELQQVYALKQPGSGPLCLLWKLCDHGIVGSQPPRFSHLNVSHQPQLPCKDTM